MTTLRDLSRHLGLSVTQISRALNGHSDVREETRLRVIEAAKTLEYQPNQSARKLATGRSGLVGLVLGGQPRSPGDSYFVQMVAGLSTYFSRRERQFVLHIAENDDAITDVYRRLADGGGLDGFVLLSPQLDDARVAFLRARNLPFVVHGRTVPHPDYPFFDIDNESVGYTLTRILTRQGHRRIAFLNGPAGQTYARWRRDGYTRALRDAGAVADPALHVHDEMTEAFGMIGALRQVTSDAAPTAIICGNSLILRGVMQTLAALGRRVPQDISVVAHDDDLPDLRSSAFFPTITVTRSPLETSWAPLAEILMGRMAGLPLTELQRWGPVTLVERDSVAAAKG